MATKTSRYRYRRKKRGKKRKKYIECQQKTICLLEFRAKSILMDTV